MPSTIIPWTAMHLKRRISIVLVALAAITWAAWPSVTAAVFLLDITGRGGVGRRLIPVGRSEISREALSIPTRHGAVAARLYAPAPASDRTAVVFPGVHGGGIDEPRLARFAERLAATGMNVLSVPLPDLRMFRITGRSTEMVEDVAVWAAANPRLARRGRVGLVGVSFAGGLAMVAAGRPALAGRLDAVLSLGGHGDLGRVLRYLCTGMLPDGTTRSPHDYGVAVVALAAVPLIAPPEQRAQLERAILTFLEASLDDSTEQRRGAALLADARRQVEAMSEPARSIATRITERDVAWLGRLLRPHVDDLARDPRLSPERSAVTRAPVFLLHGLDDNVIPSSETPALAASLAKHGAPPARWLLTPALSHVGLDTGIGLADRWRLVRFWRAVRAAMAQRDAPD